MRSARRSSIGIPRRFDKRLAASPCLTFSRYATRAIASLPLSLDAKSHQTPVDLAVIAYLQINQVDLSTAIKRVATHVKPGGHLMGVWHSRDNLEHSFGGPRDPEVLPNPELLNEYLAGEGFEIIDCRNRDGQIQTREGLKPSVTAVLFARKLA